METKLLPRNALVAATFTAMHPNGTLNLSAIGHQASILQEDGVAGAFICGTTGEGPSLSSVERMQIAESWRASVRLGALKVIVHVGHNSLPEAVSLAKHAETIGADAISIAAPNYFKAQSVDDLLSFCVPVAKAAPSLPFYFYEIPSLTGVSVSMTEFLEKSSHMIPNMAGIKFSSTDMAVMQECCAFGNGRFEVLFGCDEMLLAALALGVHGAVGSTYSYAAPLYNKMIAAFDQGNLSEARALQLKSVELVRILQHYGVLASGKAAMSCRGIECGSVRPPLHPLTEPQRQALLGSLGRSGVFREIVRR
ncbi:MAG: dihydrodipicolinate synthase family protein [Opitutaceae bacterium]|jgi:N-acetylneuraminate lyase|nr:dihydrodipicolinate synthase family protein [Opitutaceae bacterium]